MVKPMKIPFTELRDMFFGLARGNDAGLVINRNRSLELLSQWKKDRDWFGSSTDEMDGYLTEGFFVEGLESLDTSTIPVRKRKRIRYNDSEGEFRYDLFMSGDDNYFADWTKRESIPGMEVLIAWGFSGGVPARTIEQYNRWILRALIAIEAAGVDCSISMFDG